ncbi:hypothetical protein [Asaia platycodi]|uniref:hypothetical protein n=1 Tax=Asaia platycodi TaxID=610243 RepID=UPI0011DD5CB9|nr:hypothetical protein [Asaia platycodi]
MSPYGMWSGLFPATCGHPAALVPCRNLVEVPNDWAAWQVKRTAHPAALLVSLSGAALLGMVNGCKFSRGAGLG